MNELIFLCIIFGTFWFYNRPIRLDVRIEEPIRVQYMKYYDDDIEMVDVDDI